MHMTIIHNCPQCGFTHASNPGASLHCRGCDHLLTAPEEPPSVAGLPIFLKCPICRTDLKGAFLETVACRTCRASYRLDEETIESLNPHVTTMSAAQPRTCPSCGMRNPALATFCEGCGEGLETSSELEAAEPEEAAPVAAAPAAPRPSAAAAPAPARPAAPRSASRTAAWPEEGRPSPFAKLGFLGGLASGAAVAALLLIIVLLVALSNRSRAQRIERERTRATKNAPARIPGTICDRCDGWGFLDKYTPSERQCPDCKGTGHNP
jgi:predicted nucleic acid binding AN1-type Zn finger protein